jgi:hypothetical protein
MAKAQTRTQLVPNPSSLLVQRKTVLGFHYAGGVFIGKSDRGPFKPRGLVIWGAPDTAVVRAATIDMEEQVLQSMDGAPAKFFALGLSFEHIAQLVEEGVEPPSWCEFITLHPGGQVRIIITDDKAQVLSPAHGITIAMWGVGHVSPELDAPPAALANGAH